jgi:hypothetical protein
VVARLFQAWAEKLPDERRPTAQMMMRFLTTHAGQGEWQFLADVNSAGAALKALRQIGQKRPEFRGLVNEEITEALVQRLAGRRFYEVVESLETAVVFASALEPAQLRYATDAALNVLGVENASSPISRPGLTYLSSETVLNLARSEPALGKRIVRAILDLGLASETEHAGLMFRVRSLDPELFDFSVRDERLTEAVENLRHRAGELNSSGAPISIAALLAAPAIAGRAGVLDAIECLKALLESAQDHPAVAFGDGYYPLLVLTQERENLSAALSLTEGELLELAYPLLEPLRRVWVKGTTDPLLFAPFSIPPRIAPSSMVVYNWAYTSLAFAKFLGAPDALNPALDVAAQSAALREPIRTARAMRGAYDDSEPFNEGALAKENAATFYSAVGRRLSRALDLELSERASVLASLAAQSFRLGPNGLDAAVFAMATVAGVRLDENSGAARNYATRLQSQPELRRSLNPLLDALFGHQRLWKQ